MVVEVEPAHTGFIRDQLERVDPYDVLRNKTLDADDRRRIIYCVSDSRYFGTTACSLEAHNMTT